MTVTTALLDVDGTLLDTREFILAAFEHASAALGFAIPPRESLSREIGRPLEAIYADLAPAAAVAAAVDLHRAYQRDNLDLVVAFPGVVDALRALVSAGVAPAGVTSRSHRSAVPSLERAGIAHLLETVVAAEDAPALKPDPAPLRVALARLGRNAGGAVMVGDTVHDIRAGQALGIPTIAAVYGFHGTDVLAAGPDRTITSPDELPAAVAGLA